MLADGAQARHDSKRAAGQLQTEARAPQQQVVQVLHVLVARAPAQLRPQGLRAGNRRQFARVRRIAQRLRLRAMAAQQARALFAIEQQGLARQGRRGVENRQGAQIRLPARQQWRGPAQCVEGDHAERRQLAARHRQQAMFQP